jgi:hypothetical protein
VGWLLGLGSAATAPYDAGRAWLPLVPALALGGVAAVWSLPHWLLSRRVPGAPFVRASAALVAGVVCCGLVVPPVVAAYQARLPDRSEAGLAYAANGGTQLEQFRTWLSDHAGGVGVLWADRSSARLVRLFANGVFGEPVWHGELEVWEPGRVHPQPAPGDYVFFYRQRPGPCPECTTAVQDGFGRAATVPDRWQSAFSTPDGGVEIYLVR